MPWLRVLVCCVLVFLTSGAANAAETASGALTITPAAFVLRGRTARQRLLVTCTKNGQAVDCTHQAALRYDTPAILHIRSDGVVTPVADGSATITATFEGRQAQATVRVVDGTRLPPATFERDVIPILTRAGCNAGACHGKARGQNGFAAVAVRFDPDFDYNAIAKEARGRRIFAAAPEYSLLLRKASATGAARRRQTPRSRLARLRGAASLDRRRHCRAHPADAPTLQRITVEPAERILRSRRRAAASRHGSLHRRLGPRQ